MKNINIKFKLSENQLNQMIKSINVFNKILIGKWEIIDELMRENPGYQKILNSNATKEQAYEELIKMRNEVCPLFKTSNGIINSSINTSEVLINKIKAVTKKNKNNIISFNLNMNDEEIGILCNSLDIVSRIYMGQWDKFVCLLFGNKTKDGKRFFDYLVCNGAEEICILQYRNRLYKQFDMDYIYGPGASYGICSLEISDNARVMYDLYKVIMYNKGAGGVHGYPPHINSKEAKLPVIEFPDIETMVFDGNIDKVVKFTENKSDEPITRKMIVEDGDLYVKTGENFYTLVVKGDKLIKKYNKTFIVKKKGG